MKFIIKVPDNTAAVSVTYVYEEDGKMVMQTKMFDTEEIDEQKGV